jgi:probable phosphoglycerate mutase
MTQVLLIRHAVNDFVKTGRLAGWTPEVHLNDEGRSQAEALGRRLADAPLAAIYASPLERTMETAQSVVQHHPHLTIRVNEGVGEVRYGEWEGMAIRELLGRKMWHMVQHTPSRASFPGGETMRGVQIRAVEAVEALVAAHPRDLIAVVTHADLIKMVLAHYLGMHLDQFQRIGVSPASISTLNLHYGRPSVEGINEIAHLKDLVIPPVHTPSPRA